ncbi:glycosyltransferase [Hymenobacter coalescens]
MSRIKIRPKVLIHCQYVYGVGHYVRTIELARGLSSQFEVFVLNGGEMVPNFDVPSSVTVIQLPAIYKEETEAFLTPVDRSQTLDECFALRSIIINQAVEEIKPAILITEHFPFGLLFEGEVIELINKVKLARPTAKTVCSVRDIIESSAGGARDAHTCDLLNHNYDMVLVHGDERFAALSTSFPRAHEIKVPIVHTGYIARSVSTTSQSGSRPIVLASVAGGRLGNELLDALIDSYPITNELVGHKLILFSGAFQKDLKAQQDKLNQTQLDGIELQPFNSRKYLECFSTASLIISLGGYNSLIESISASKPLLIYNRDFAGSNKEQHLRIKLFESSGHLEIITPADLTPNKLSNLISRKLNSLPVPACSLNMQGAEASCESLARLLSDSLIPV